MLSQLAFLHMPAVGTINGKKTLLLPIIIKSIKNIYKRGNQEVEMILQCSARCTVPNRRRQRTCPCKIVAKSLQPSDYRKKGDLKNIKEINPGPLLANTAKPLDSRRHNVIPQRQKRAVNLP